MEYRKLYIEFVRCEWHILPVGYNGEEYDKIDDIIAPIISVKNNKIMYIFDILGIEHKQIKECEKIDLFNEVCEFIHEDLNGNLISKFEGTFIDALKYIQTHFKG